MRMAFMTIAFASFYAGEFPGVKGGVFAVFGICAALSFMTDLIGKFIAPVFFKPDITATADPLAPDPKIPTAGLCAAFALAASRGRSVRLLVSRIPGYDVELRINASGSYVETVISAPGKKPLKHKTPIAKLIPRRSPAVFALPGNGGANALLIVNPDATWRVPFACEPRRRLGWKVPVFSAIVVIANLWRAGML